MLLLQLLRGRWMMAVVSFYILFCAGAGNIFGLYSGAIKQALNYDQQTIDTLAFFKDIGTNVGIVSALLNEVLPAWIIVAMGAFMNLFGYLMVWLSITHRIARPQTWHMYLFLCIGANSQTFASIAVLVTFVRNFPQGRGEVLGILKGCVGLSGAIFTQVYLAIYVDDGSGVILLIGWLASLVSLTFMFFIRPIAPVYDKHETRNFYRFLYLALLLAAFLMLANIVENEFHKIPSIVYKACAAFTLILVISNLIIAIRAEYGFQAEAEECTATKGKMLQEICTIDKEEVPVKDEVAKASNSGVCHFHQELEKDKWSHKNENLKPQEEADSVIDWSSLSSEKGNCTSVSKEGHLGHLMNFSRKPKIFTKFFKNWPERGEDFTIPQALFSMDMWILFISITCGLGASITAVDNIGQIGESQGYEKRSINTCVSLISIWSFLGRVSAGFGSEFLLRYYRFPRTLALTIVLGVACIGHLLIALPAPSSLYIASVMEGWCYGAQLPLFLAIISEIFGLKYYSTLQSVAVIVSPLGSYGLNVRVAGHLYDLEARRQQERLLLYGGVHGEGAPTAMPNTLHGNLKCMGSQCFRLAFLIMTMVSACGCLVSSLLVLRTKTFYAQDIYSKFHLNPSKEQNQQET